jgi:2-amino-4-hydroxy-6-hydroxymethyldihydropteridine diphosphokinase
MSSHRNTTANSRKELAAPTLIALVSLGSNLPHQGLSPRQILSQAIDRLSALSVKSQVSSLYLSEARDCPPGTGDFVNAAMLLYLPLTSTAHEFLQLLQAIESDFGRQRGELQNQARTLDLDLISFANQQLVSEKLSLPHPRAKQRRFVLLPLAEICPELLLAGESHNIAQLLQRLAPQEKVELLS